MATMVLMSLVANAQNAAEARKILDKTASVVGRKGGASANFTVSSSKVGTVSGSIAIKGNMFHARTPQAIVCTWQHKWSYMKSTNEVNISTPTEAQNEDEPLTFLTCTSRLQPEHDRKR
jgi:hypothetical protein